MMKRSKSARFVAGILILPLAAMMATLPVSATPVSKKAKDATAVWLAAIEPGVNPKQAKKYKAVKKNGKKGSSIGNSAFSSGVVTLDEDVTVPGTNMSAMVLDRLKVSEQVTPETTALFGETIDLNTGVVSMQQVDISIPGNFNIPVEFRRIYRGGQYSAYSNLNLGDWNIAIPSISTTVIYDHITYQQFSGNWGSGSMCSGQFNPGNFAVGPNQIIASGEYWSGENLDIPGVISEKIQVTYEGYTTKRFIKNWKFACTTVNIGGATIEGLKATSPDGTTYEFTQPKLIPTTSMSAANGLGIDEVVAKYNAFLLVSKITDRFGNSVTYGYTDGQLTSISSSDGRSIGIEYETNAYGKKRVSSISANGQTWDYRYQNATHPSNIDYLTEVERPDGKVWQFSLNALGNSAGSATQRDYYYHIKYDPEGDAAIIDLYQIIETQCIDFIPSANPALNAHIIHPDGARLDLKIRATRFGRSEVPKILSNYSGYPHGDVHANDLCFVSNSLEQKTLSGPGLNTLNWQYSYSQNKGGWAVSPQSGTSIAEEPLNVAVVPLNYQLRDLRATSITTPDGAKTVHVFSRRWDHTDGQEVGTEYYDTDGTTLLRRIERQFVAEPTGGSVEMTSYTGNELGTGYLTDNPMPHENYINKTSEKVISYVDGTATDTYTTLFPEEHYNVYGFPTKQIERNSLNTAERTTITTYHQDPVNWVLNQVANRQISQNGETFSESSTTYFADSSPEKSLPKEQKRFGQLVQSHEYFADGNLKKTTYAMTNRWVSFANYKRGKPQTITLPKRYDSTAINVLTSINDTGTIAYTHDLNGNKTSYAYDSLNRVTSITPADTKWAPTTISYDAATLATGALQQNIVRGQYRKSVVLDGLMQPILSKEWDNAAETDTARFINQKFNAYGKATFTSVPSATPDETYGSTTTYDGLQRVLNQTNTGNGDLSYSYGSNNSITVTNGKNYSTSTRYLAYGTPETSLATLIEQPEAATTSISYNAANLPTAITQGGITETRRYNNKMEMCVQKRPDIGLKVFTYNALGQIDRYYDGVLGNGTHCSDYTHLQSAVVQHYYDNYGDLSGRGFGDGTSTIRQTYDGNGNLLSTSGAGVNGYYEYNSLNLPKKETLMITSSTQVTGAISMSSIVINYDYDALGNLKSSNISSMSGYGPSLTHIYNALGQATTVKDEVVTYAAAGKYHPNGQLKSFEYGNGLVFNQTLNNKSKPELRTVQKDNVLRMSQQYGYDDNENLDSITDAVNPVNSISMIFDGLDRLVTANGYWGNGTIAYDSLGNITQKDLGTDQRTYTYDTNNRLTNVTGGYNFSYDYRGNVVNNGKRAFTFNGAQQLKTSGDVWYLYDGLGRRMKKFVGNDEIYNMYNLQGQLVHISSKEGATHYIYLGKQQIAKLSPNAEYKEKSGYTGHLEDKDIGLTYMQARYYDPVIGRFYSNDPVGFNGNNPMTFNRYAYANNNPYKYTDPDGRTAIPFPLTPMDTGVGPTGVQDLTPEQQTQGAAMVAGALVGGLALNGAKAAVMSLASRTTTVGRGQQVGRMIKSDGSTKASDIKAKAESVGFKPTQSGNGPLKMVDENGTPRVTIKGGSDRAPGSQGPHVELKDSSGQRVNPAGEPVTRRSPENHTPIKDDL